MSVPFSVDAVFTSFADMEGLARFDANGLALEFQVKNNVFGIIKSQPKEVLIPFADLADVSFKRGWFRGVLTVRARRMSAIADIPGNDGAELRLRCRRRHRDAAQELVSQLSMHMVSQDLQRMVQETSRVVRPLSAPPPPVTESDSARTAPPARNSGGMLQ